MLYITVLFFNIDRLHKLKFLTFLLIFHGFLKMNYTIFDTPILSTVIPFLSRLILNMLGWRTEGKAPDLPKYIIIAAPHTSNWDFLYTLLFAFAEKLDIYWMGKDAIFKKPFRGLMMWLGGIPVDRSKATGLVERSIQAFAENKKLTLVVPPSGTRKKVIVWKTGFYHIAAGANVPIVLGYINYQQKTIGLGPAVVTTGDMDADMKKINTFYSNLID